MDFKFYVDFAQIVTAIITFFGVLVSIYFSIKTLKEVQQDRKFAERPFLILEPGAMLLPIVFEKVGKRIPGFNPDFIEEKFKHLPDDIESIRLYEKVDKKGYLKNRAGFGSLKNFGNGPALETRVLWKATDVIFKDKSINLNTRKNEPQYSEELNTFVVIPRQVLPENEAKLIHLPTFVEKDIKKEIESVEGIIEIQYLDMFFEHHVTKQEFRIFTGYEENNNNKDRGKYIHIVFGDLLRFESRK